MTHAPNRAASVAAGSAVVQSKAWYRQLYVQVLVAIVIGIVLG